ncbi:hypothetical protein NY2A_B492R [Paramecium bursaria Chlorella virus NY2A]|uniref:Uncharacterized protein B492R n=1 Tax=Paramecium bursaria Chlorella virus NY2A TaxID=46021 RepID=A7IX17_PBCVN|nr:hypothetical protein NY2A_B492R [Paramecium bursaria Chlorella virus NY2A]ABT14891.1 hypothetical protein NY2A_B492R [Paramecium bursaria Chlorella virus NY2A]
MRTNPYVELVHRRTSYIDIHIIHWSHPILVHRPATTSDRDQRILQAHIMYIVLQQDSLDQNHPISISFGFLSSIQKLRSSRDRISHMSIPISKLYRALRETSYEFHEMLCL